ncbi:MAG: AI-2E family transporter [Gammaproteobacteria bacterium]|nr:AI-2E family transporter [Gammaproteobacteria bacterium]
MQTLRPYLTFFGLILAGYVIYLLAPVLKPFLFGAILAYMGNPFVSFLQRHKVSRSWGVSLLFIIFALIIGLIMLAIVPRVFEQIQNFSNQSQQALTWAQANLLPWINAHTGLNLQVSPDQVQSFISKHAGQSQNYVQDLVKNLALSSLAILALLMDVLICLVATFYLMRDWPKLLLKFHAFLPLRIQPLATKLGREIHQVLQAFFRGTLIVMLVLIVFYSIGLSIIGLNTAILIAVIAGVLSIVPYLGLIIGLLMAVTAAAFQFGDVSHCVWVIVVFGAAQLLSDMVLQPVLIGNKIGLHPLMVIFAVFAGEALFGFMGILLSIPAAAVINVLLKYALSRYLDSRYYLQND